MLPATPGSQPHVAVGDLSAGDERAGQCLDAQFLIAAHHSNCLPTICSGNQNGRDHDLAPSVTALHSSCAAQRGEAMRVSQGRPLGFLATGCSSYQTPTLAPTVRAQMLFDCCRKRREAPDRGCRSAFQNLADVTGLAPIGCAKALRGLTIVGRIRHPVDITGVSIGIGSDNDL
jgi:hypothetical protein